MNASSKILALDTATTGCSVCLWSAGVVLGERAEEMARGQAQALVPMMQGVLNDADVAPDAIDAVAVTRGPGAFTGLRIGLSAARAFAMALGVPCVGVTTLEAVAENVTEDERVGRKTLVCIESKRADIFVQLFDADLKALTEPLAVGEDALAGLFSDGEALVLVGDAAVRAKDMLGQAELDVLMSTASPLPVAATVARIASARIEGAQTPEPLYLRPPDAKLPKNAGRARP
ncbi:tRNA (adenosine(37)-N6)-threonylcarbamoyltransferase complex dimerization subunit type 1 TsaB [Pseudomonadota bacterium]